MQTAEAHINSDHLEFRSETVQSGEIHTYKPKSNIGAGKLFHRNTSFSTLFQPKIKKYFAHKLIKNPSKNDISTIFWKLLSGSIRRAHPLFTPFIKKKYKKTVFYQISLNLIVKNIKIWKISPLRGLCDRTDLKKWKNNSPRLINS